MAIIQCSNCKNSISEYAKFCPHCANNSLVKNPPSIEKIISTNSKTLISDKTKVGTGLNEIDLSKNSNNRTLAIAVFSIFSIIIFLFIIFSSNKISNTKNQIFETCLYCNKNFTPGSGFSVLPFYGCIRTSRTNNGNPQKNALGLYTNEMYCSQEHCQLAK